MNILDTASGIFNIEGLPVVQSFTMPSSAEVSARVQVGDDANPILGGGLYRIRYAIDGLERDSYFDIAAGISKTVIQSNPFIAYAGEMVDIYIQGITGDSSVRIVSILNDVTAGGGGGETQMVSGLIGSVIPKNAISEIWTQDEKKTVMEELFALVRNMNALIADKSLQFSMDGMSSRTSEGLRDAAAQISDLAESMASIRKRMAGVKEIEALKNSLVGETVMVRRMLRESSDGLGAKIDGIAIGDLMARIDSIERIVVKLAPTEILEELNEHIGK